MVSLQTRSDAKPNWLMPANFGPITWEGDRPVDGPEGESRYEDVTSISVSYLTDEAKLKSYLPECYELEGPPLLTVGYSQCRDISWLAGGAYNLVGVTAKVKFKGKKEELTGAYVLILWESLTEPILVGREALGLAKIHGDIEDLRKYEGVWSTRLSKNSSTILDLKVSGLEKWGSTQLSALQETAGKGSMLGWKYIPNEMKTEPIVSYPTVLPTKNTFHEAWSAEASLEWHPQEWKTNPTQSHIVNALAGLPVGEIKACTVSHRSLTLLSGQARRLE